MGDGPAERRLLGRPLRIDVDPLVVAGGVGEEVHLLLVDDIVVGPPEVLTDERLDPLGAMDAAAWRRSYSNQIRWYSRRQGVHQQGEAGHGEHHDDEHAGVEQLGDAVGGGDEHERQQAEDADGEGEVVAPPLVVGDAEATEDASRRRWRSRAAENTVP